MVWDKQHQGSSAFRRRQPAGKVRTSAIRICLSFTAQQSKAMATRETLAATRALVSSDISSRRRTIAPMGQPGSA
jgi:hypothetical protein